MAKGSGTTRGGSARNPRGTTTGAYASGGSFRGENASTALNAMRDSLQRFARQNGFTNGFGNSILKTFDSDMGRDNVKSASIDISQEYSGGSVTLGYEVRITGSRAAQYGSKDFDAYQNEIFYDNGRRYKTLNEAYKGMNERVERLNKMQIR